MVDALLEEPFMMTVYGPRKTGKSWLIKHLLLEKMAQFFDEIHVLCGSLRFNSDYDDFRKQGYRYKKKFKWYPDPGLHDLDEIFLSQSDEKEAFMNFKRGDELIYMMKKMSGTKRKKRKILAYPDEVENPEPIFPRTPHGFYTKKIGTEPESKHVKDRPNKVKKILIILDDVVDSGVLSRASAIDKYAMRGRHIEVSCITASQRISPTSINVRDNADMMIIFRPYSVQEFERLVDTFIPTNNKKMVRQKIMDIFETDHDFVVVDNMNKKPYEKIGKSNCDEFLNNQITKVNVMDEEKRFGEEGEQQKTKGKKRKIEQDMGEKKRKK